MTSNKTIGLLFAVALLLGAFAVFASPGHAADPVCDYTYDEVKQQFADAGEPVVEIDPAKLPKFIADLEAKFGGKHPNVTRAFAAEAGGKVLVGLEENGCLSPPIVVGIVKQGRSA